MALCLGSSPALPPPGHPLVTTAPGLLLRLLKTGQYAFSRASLVILRDAFTAIRNHPANTVVRGASSTRWEP